MPFVTQTASSGTAPAAPRNTVASIVRAELARRRISGREIAGVLKWSERTARRRLGGSTPFTVDELAAVARHLEVPISDLLP